MVYQEREKIEGTLKRQAPLLKGFNEFEYGFKIRDKENPKNWCAAVHGRLHACMALPAVAGAVPRQVSASELKGMIVQVCPGEHHRHSAPGGAGNHGCGQRQKLLQ